MSTDRSTLLRRQSAAFLDALTKMPHPPQPLSSYFTAHPTIHEHGPSWATSTLPFLARPFTGPEEFEKYFELLSSTLRMVPDAFPPPEEFAVSEKADGGKGAVFVEGGGDFASVKTGRKWKETFVHRFSGFDEQGRIGKWEIWADPLSAYDAVKGGVEGGEQ